MKSRYLILVAVLAAFLFFAFAPGCGDDDDDDDDSGVDFTCQEGADIIYDECGGTWAGLAKDQFVSICEQMGVGACENGCGLDYQEDEDCTALEACLLECAEAY